MCRRPAWTFQPSPDGPGEESHHAAGTPHHGQGVPTEGDADEAGGPNSDPQRGAGQGPP